MFLTTERVEHSRRNGLGQSKTLNMGCMKRLKKRMELLKSNPLSPKE